MRTNFVFVFFLCNQFLFFDCNVCVCPNKGIEITFRIITVQPEKRRWVSLKTITIRAWFYSNLMYAFQHIQIGLQHFSYGFGRYLILVHKVRCQCDFVEPWRLRSTATASFLERWQFVLPIWILLELFCNNKFLNLIFHGFTSGRFSLADESSVCNMDE